MTKVFATGSSSIRIRSAFCEVSSAAEKVYHNRVVGVIYVGEYALDLDPLDHLVIGA